MADFWSVAASLEDKEVLLEVFEGSTKCGGSKIGAVMVEV